MHLGRLVLSLSIALLATLGCRPATVSEAPKNIIFFGNSFTIGSGGKEASAMNGIPGIVQAIAVAAGHPAPRVQKSTRGGKTLEWHVQNKLHTIANPDQHADWSATDCWDYVVMQEYSTRPTAPGEERPGKPELFFQYANELYAAVRKHSPDAKGVLYETWARSRKRAKFYPDLFKDPFEFQAQLKANYEKCVAKLNAAGGSVTLARAGEAWQKLDFAEDLYAGDRYHASNKGSLLNALVIYRAIYGGTTAGLNLRALGRKLKLSRADWKAMAEIADGM